MSSSRSTPADSDSELSKLLLTSCEDIYGRIQRLQDLSKGSPDVTNILSEKLVQISDGFSFWHCGLLENIMSGGTPEKSSDVDDHESFNVSMSDSSLAAWSAMLPKIMQSLTLGLSVAAIPEGASEDESDNDESNFDPPRTENLQATDWDIYDRKPTFCSSVDSPSSIVNEPSLTELESSQPQITTSALADFRGSVASTNQETVPVMSITPFSSFSTRLRQAVTGIVPKTPHHSHSEKPGTGATGHPGKAPRLHDTPATLLSTLGRTPPSPPLLRVGFRTGGARHPRVVELKVPSDLRLVGLVYHEALGDVAEEIAFTHLFRSKAANKAEATCPEQGHPSGTTRSATGDASRGRAPLNAPLRAASATRGGKEPAERHPPTQAELRQAALGQLCGLIVGSTLSQTVREQVDSAFAAIDPIKWSSREADIEYTFQRVIGDILTAMFNHIGASGFYIHHGSSPTLGLNVIEDEEIPSYRAIPDLEYMLPCATDNETETTLSAVEIKTDRSLIPNFCFTLFKTSIEQDGYLAEQLEHCPGFAARFLWPLSHDNILSEETAIMVQIWTAMVAKNLCTMEVTSGGQTSFFVWRRDVKSKVLYISRPYVNDDPNSCGNLTRFAFLYLAIHDLLGQLGDRVPAEQVDHWAEVPLPSASVRKPGVDVRTIWKERRGRYGIRGKVRTVSVKGRTEYGDRRVVTEMKKEAQRGQSTRTREVGSRGRERLVPAMYPK